MKVTESGDTFDCSCGFSWQRGTNGTHNCEPGLYRQITALQQKLDAVVAENVVSRKAVQVFCDVVGSNTDAICEEIGAEGVKAILAAMSATGNMPATDAILNALRAEGVDMFATSQRAKIGKPHQNDAVLAYSSRVAYEFAYKLRAGDADKAGE